ncbi:uncharacterized protein OCT59_003765 [Rhizophagus irregularis]|nr:hypothetical protein OCT59_003765 [Rhizophagus irregularis]GBC17451.1 hypothetical protein RIR_jg28337.t1 [Rhizophagus irregularis DAOM 181602=DAOM 197198]
MQIILANKIMMMELVALGCRINEKKEDREIYVRDISPQQNNDRNNNGKYAAQEQPINSNGEDFKMLNLRLAIIIGKTVQNGLQAMHGRKKTMQPCGPKHST